MLLTSEMYLCDCVDNMTDVLYQCKMMTTTTMIWRIFIYLFIYLLISRTWETCT